MSIDTNTANVLLCMVVALQSWIVRELFKLKIKLSVIVAQCKLCSHNSQLNTDQIIKRK